MTVHRYHPDPERGEVKSLLYDDCDRCAQHATHPLNSLDPEHLVALAKMTDNQAWTNDTERKACLSLCEGLFDLGEALRAIAERRWAKL